MLSYTKLTLYDEFPVFWLRIFPQFWLILHLLDPDPHSDCGSRKPIECGSKTELDPKHCQLGASFVSYHKYMWSLFITL
jgi:hypothetical protein